jgi:hypothetical protein
MYICFVTFRVLCKGKGKEQAMKAQMGIRGVPLLFFNLGARRGWVVNATPRTLYPREIPGTHCTVREAG